MPTGSTLLQPRRRKRIALCNDVTADRQAVGLAVIVAEQGYVRQRRGIQVRQPRQAMIPAVEAGLPIAEAHEVASAGWSQHGREAGDVPGPVVVAEYMEHPAIDDGVGSAAEAAEVECVRDFEPRGQPALGRSRARPRDRGRRDVDAGDIGATTGC
jgi:hypothetical protein